MGLILLIAGYVCRRWIIRGFWLAAYVVVSIGLAFVAAEDIPRGLPVSGYVGAAAYLGAMAAIYGVMFLALGRGAAAIAAWVRRGER